MLPRANGAPGKEDSVYGGPPLARSHLLLAADVSLSFSSERLYSRPHSKAKLNFTPTQSTTMRTTLLLLLVCLFCFQISADA